MRLGGRESGGWLELGPAPPPTQAAWQVHTVTVRRRRYPLADRRLTGPWFVPAHETGALGHTNARSRSNLDSAPPSGERRAAQMDGASFLCGLPPVVRSISQTRPCGAVSPASWNWRRPRRLPSRANHVAATRPPQRGFAEKNGGHGPPGQEKVLSATPLPFRTDSVQPSHPLSAAEPPERRVPILLVPFRAGSCCPTHTPPGENQSFWSSARCRRRTPLAGHPLTAGMTRCIPAGRLVCAPVRMGDTAGAATARSVWGRPCVWSPQRNRVDPPAAGGGAPIGVSVCGGGGGLPHSVGGPLGLLVLEVGPPPRVANGWVRGKTLVRALQRPLFLPWCCITS